MKAASYGFTIPEETVAASRKGRSSWYLITSEELEQIRDTLLDIGNNETGEGRIRIWELTLLLDTIQDRLA